MRDHGVGDGVPVGVGDIPGRYRSTEPVFGARSMHTAGQTTPESVVTVHHR
jgi:hypothetical protein